MPSNLLVKTAISYAEAGYTLILLRGRVPATKKWPQTPYTFFTDVPDLLKGWDGGIGVVLGPTNLVLDVDQRNFPKGVNSFKNFLDKLGLTTDQLKETAAVTRTGGGGLHFYWHIPKGYKPEYQLDEFKGLDFLSGNRYVVGAGSKHYKTGKIYKWVGGQPFDKVKMAPQVLLDFIESRKSLVVAKKNNGHHPVVIVDNSEATQKKFSQYLRKVRPAIEGEHGDQHTYDVACRGHDFGLSEDITLELMRDIFNPRCDPPWDDDELETKVSNAYKYALNTQGNRSPHRDFGEVAPVKAKSTWHLTEKGQLKTTSVLNVMNYFIYPEYGMNQAIGYNQLETSVWALKPLPWTQPKETFPRQWGDLDDDAFRGWLSKTEQFNPSISTLTSGVRAYSQKFQFHPIQDYLNRLVWDGKHRLNRFLIRYAGAEDSAYTEAVTRKTILQAVCRAMNPGCQADYVLVLESRQGKNKSQLVRLLGGPWYTDLHINPNNKDTADALRGKWICEISEMEVTRRTDAQALKAFLTRQVDRIRPAYGRITMDLPRSVIFIGTVNPDATQRYFIDTTGNRRFWPLPIKKAMLPEIRKIRDQLFAEAMHYRKLGELPYITDDGLSQTVENMQASRQQVDPWKEDITRYLRENSPIDFIVASDIYALALHGSKAAMSVVHQRRIGAILRALGWVQHITRIKGTVTRGWKYDPGSEESEPDLTI